MKFYIKIFTFLFITLLVNISFSQNSLKVVTYNIQGMRPGTNPATRIQHIIENFKTLDPDIIGLQEINEDKIGDNSDNQVIVIANALSNHFNIPYYYYYKKTHDAWNNQFKEYVGIISKHPFEEQGYMDLTPGIFPRKVVWGLFDTPIGKINFFNTHLSYYSAWVNEKEIDEILNFAGAKMAIQSNNNAIITGDFNATPDTPSYLKMINGNYTDSYLFINPNSNGYTASYPGTSIRIDYIFMNSSSDLIIDDSYLIMKQPISQNFYCSDHLGIMTTFSNPTFVDIEEETEIPMNFSLSQNYPNPFNPTTTIKYTVPFVQTHRNASVHTTLKVYNNLGNEVATLVTEFQLPGEQVVEFNVETLHATSLQSGIYFYQLTVGDKTLTKKMLLLK